MVEIHANNTNKIFCELNACQCDFFVLQYRNDDLVHLNYNVWDNRPLCN